MQHSFCRLCGCWRGSLGLEPTPELYIEHLAGIFRQVRRVLRDDGTLWLNIGGSYASGKGTCFNPGGGVHSLEDKRKERGAYPLDRGNVSTLRASGLKPKDWVPIPWMLGMALQRDGWYLRSPIIWAKGLSFCETYSGSVMPESVRDRPTTSYEHLLLLTKSKNYFYDQDAVREPQSLTTHSKGHSPRTTQAFVGKSRRADGKVAHKDWHETTPLTRLPAGRNLRSVWAIGDSVDEFTQYCLSQGVDLGALAEGYLEGQLELKDTWTINPYPFPDAHFATFPPKLVEPCIKAGTSERGCCPNCGKGWERIVEKTVGVSSDCPKTQAIYQAQGGLGLKATGTIGQSGGGRIDGTTRAIGWRPGCSCYDQLYRTQFPKARRKRKREQREAWSGGWWDRVRKRPGKDDWQIEPCLITDIFSGAGTTVMVALRLGRRAIGIDLSEKYTAMARKRIINDNPMFNIPGEATE